MTTTSATSSIVSALKADATTAALVGTRVYKDRAYVKAKLPNIVTHKITDVHSRHSTGVTGLVRTRVQVNCNAVSRSGAKSLSDAVYDVLKAKTAESIGTSPNNMFVGSTGVDEIRDDFIQPEQSDKPGGQRGIFVNQVDVIVWHGD